jgi:hypothetical protein
METLRLLLVLMSKSVYLPNSNTINPWLRYLVTKLDKPIVLALLCCLLNVIGKYNPAGWVPYASLNQGLMARRYDHMLFGDAREPLVLVAAEVLNVLLSYTFDLSAVPTSSNPMSEPTSPLSPQTADPRCAFEKITAFLMSQPERLWKFHCNSAVRATRTRQAFAILY